MSLASNLFYGAKTDQVNPNLILLGNEKKIKHYFLSNFALQDEGVAYVSCYS